MSKLVELKVVDYLDVLKSNAPAPGGGSVSALAGAQGAGLVAMVTDLTLGKEKFADFEEVCKDVKEKAIDLYEALTLAIDEDTEAFNLVAAAFKMPKETDEEKAARSAAIQAGTIKSTEVPFKTMELSLEGLKLATRLVGQSNPNCASDLGVGIINFRTAVEGAWLNVLINISGIKNQALAEDFRVRGLAMVKEAKKLSDEFFPQVEQSL